MVGGVVGLIIVAIGLVGIGFGLEPMMTHANPNAMLISVGGLATAVVALLVTVYLLR
jgi:hypothetical protein